MNVVAVVQARMGSSRLPGKSLLALGHRPMLQHVLDRVRLTGGVADFVLATSTAPADDALQQLATGAGWDCYRGSEWDVLARVRDAAAWRGADAVLRVTADCPFWDPEVGTHVVAEFRRLSGVADYVSNDTLISGYPDGLDAEVFTRAALETSAAQATDKAEREHVTTWMRRHLRTHLVRCETGDFSRHKLSIDRPGDYAYARLVWKKLPSRTTQEPCRVNGVAVLGTVTYADDYRMAATLAACALAEEECR